MCLRNQQHGQRHTNTTPHWWPLLAVRCDVLIHLASPQKFKCCTSSTTASNHCPRRREQECWPTIPPVSAVLAIRSNQCYRLPFPVMGKWPWPLEQSPTPPKHTGTHKHLTSSQKGGGRLWGRPITLSVSPCTYSCQYMCNGKYSSSQKGRGATFPHWPLCTMLSVLKKSSHSSRSHCQHTSFIIRMADSLLLDL